MQICMIQAAPAHSFSLLPAVNRLSFLLELKIEFPTPINAHKNLARDQLKVVSWIGMWMPMWMWIWLGMLMVSRALRWGHAKSIKQNGLTLRQTIRKQLKRTSNLICKSDIRAAEWTPKRQARNKRSYRATSSRCSIVDRRYLIQAKE